MIVRLFARQEDRLLIRYKYYQSIPLHQQKLFNMLTAVLFCSSDSRRSSLRAQRPMWWRWALRRPTLTCAHDSTLLYFFTCWHYLADDCRRVTMQPADDIRKTSSVWFWSSRLLTILLFSKRTCIYCWEGKSWRKLVHWERVQSTAIGVHGYRPA